MYDDYNFCPSAACKLAASDASVLLPNRLNFELMVQGRHILFFLFN